jgi:hypothetical protein
MKELFWSTLAMLFLVFPAHADEAKLVGKWRAEYALSSKDKPHIAWILELERGGTFRMTELAPNAPEKVRKEMEKVETGRWRIIEPSLTEKLKSIASKTETRVRLQFAPTPDDVKRGETREYIGRIVEKNERYNGKTTLHLTATSALEGRTGNRAVSSFNFVRLE